MKKVVPPRPSFLQSNKQPPSPPPPFKPKQSRNYGAACLIIILAVLAAGLRPHPDRAPVIFAATAPHVYTLTPPSNLHMGGTGFGLRTDSGRVYTITNGHICELAEGNMLAARGDMSERPTLLQVLEVSEEADLCILEAVPGETGLSIAQAPVGRWDHLYMVGHPHLRPNTLAEGFPVSREAIDLVEQERTPAQCTGPTRHMKHESMLAFGLIPIEMDVCVRRLDAIGTSLQAFGGNSGSPVMNEDGKVVGVLFASENSTNHGYFVPFAQLLEFLSKY